MSAGSRRVQGSLCRPPGCGKPPSTQIPHVGQGHTPCFKVAETTQREPPGPGRAGRRRCWHQPRLSGQWQRSPGDRRFLPSAGAPVSISGSRRGAGGAFGFSRAFRCRRVDFTSCSEQQSAYVGTCYSSEGPAVSPGRGALRPGPCSPPWVQSVSPAPLSHADTAGPLPSVRLRAWPSSLPAGSLPRLRAGAAGPRRVCGGGEGPAVGQVPEHEGARRAGRPQGCTAHFPDEPPVKQWSESEGL